MAFRDGPFENLKVPLAWTAAVVVVVGLIASVILLFGDTRTESGTESLGPVRSGLEAGATPVGTVLSAPIRWTDNVIDYVGGYFFAVSENRRLKAELREMQGWRDDAIALKNVNARYEQMLGVQTDPPIEMVTGLAITDARGPFARARLLNIGNGKGVRIGNPVLSEHGLVGRIVGTSPVHSRMLLLTDVSSRIPVVVERTDARAMLTGDGSGSPRLDYVRGQDAVREGDRVVSSGDGGGLPRGLPIGVAAKGLDGSWRVKLYSDRASIDYVRVLLFQSFGLLADQNALNAPALAAIDTAPSPTPTEAAAIRDVATRRAAATAAATERVRAANAAAAATPVPVSTGPAATVPAAPRPRTTTPRPTAPQPAPAQTVTQPAPAPATDGAQE